MKTITYCSLFLFLLALFVSSFDSLMITDKRFLSPNYHPNNNLKEALSSLIKQKQAVADSNDQDLLDYYSLPSEMKSKLNSLANEEKQFAKESQEKLLHIPLEKQYATTLLNPVEYYYYYHKSLPTELSSDTLPNNIYSDVLADKIVGLLENEVLEDNSELRYSPKRMIVKRNNRIDLKRDRSSTKESNKLSDAITENEKRINNEALSTNLRSQQGFEDLMKKKAIDGNSSIEINLRKIEDNPHLRQKRLRTRSRILDKYYGIPKQEVLNKIKSLMIDKNFRRFGKRDALEQHTRLEESKDKQKKGVKDESIRSGQISNNEQYLNSDRTLAEAQDIHPEPNSDKWIYNEAAKNLIMSLSLIRKKRFVELDADDEGVIKKDIANENLKTSYSKDLEDGYLASNESALDYQEDNTFNMYSKYGKENYPSLEEYKALMRDNQKKKRSVSSYSNVNSDKSKEDDDKKFNDVDQLSKNEDALIAEAIEMMQKDSNPKGNLANVKEKIENKPDAAYDLKDLRLALLDLRNVMNKERDKNGRTNKNYKVANTDRKYIRDCSALQALTTECASLKDIVPKGRIQNMFLEACKWHQICYSCGEAYELLPNQCESGFLKQTLRACNGLNSCQSAAQLIVMSLRESKSFYKPRVPTTCYLVDCVRDSLIGYKKR